MSRTIATSQSREPPGTHAVPDRPPPTSGGPSRISADGVTSPSLRLVRHHVLAPRQRAETHLGQPHQRARTRLRGAEGGPKPPHPGATEPLVDALRAHQTAQLEERMAAGPRWQDNDLVFATRTGRPIERKSELARLKDDPAR